MAVVCLLSNNKTPSGFALDEFSDHTGVEVKLAVRRKCDTSLSGRRGKEGSLVCVRSVFLTLHAVYCFLVLTKLVTVFSFV